MDQVCVSQLLPGGTESTNMMTRIVSNATLPEDKLLQHSHSPCITANWIIVKLDSFAPRHPVDHYHGVLRVLQQAEDNLWLAVNRSSGHSRVLTSNSAFVNNHFWNCYESDGSVVVETVATTSVPPPPPPSPPSPPSSRLLELPRQLLRGQPERVHPEVDGYISVAPPLPRAVRGNASVVLQPEP
jgi:hypothetical protein